MEASIPANDDEQSKMEVSSAPSSRCSSSTSSSSEEEQLPDVSTKPKRKRKRHRKKKKVVEPFVFDEPVVYTPPRPMRVGQHIRFDSEDKIVEKLVKVKICQLPTLPTVKRASVKLISSLVNVVKKSDYEEEVAIESCQDEQPLVEDEYNKAKLIQYAAGLEGSGLPLLDILPSVEDLLAFKLYVLDANHQPKISEYVFAHVLGVEEKSLRVRVYTENSEIGNICDNWMLTTEFGELIQPLLVNDFKVLVQK